MGNVPSFNLEKLIEDAKSIITNPVGFYRKLPITGGFIEPLIFVIAMALLAAVIMIIFSVISGHGLGLGTLLAIPVMMAIASFISAGILYLIWMVMGSDHSYETAYRCVAYSMAIMPISALLSILPLLGLVIPALWGAFLMITASTEVHGLDKKTATLVFGILALVSVIANVTGQKKVRNMEKELGKLGELGESIQDMTPEEAGKAVGEFTRGFEDATK